MPRLSVLFSLSGVALSATPVDFASPLTIGEDGRFISTSNVFVGGSSQGTPLQIRLTSGPLVVIGADVSNATIPAEIAFNMVDNMYRIYPLRVPHAMYHGVEASSYMGIGADSRLAGQSGSVAVVRRNSTSAELIISSTRENFRANCRPDTLVTVEASSASRQVEVEVNLWNGTESTSFGSHRLEMGGRTVFPKRALIPQAVYVFIRDHLISNGFVAGWIPWEFSHCSAAVIAGLPSVDFQFASGSIVYYPEDFMDFNALDSTCRLRFSSAETEALVIDPLMLVGQNVRFSRESGWDICDASL